MKTLLLTLLAAASFATDVSAEVHELCRAQSVASLEVSGLKSPSMKALMSEDFCREPGPSLPSPVVSLLQKLGGVHRRVAEVIGLEPKALFGEGVAISFRVDEEGPRASFTFGDGSRVSMSLFPDSDLEDWSTKIYAHELVHWLQFKGTPFTAAMRGFEKHPFLTEALPDLIALTAYDDPVMALLDSSDLPRCLVETRDAHPARSLAMPWGFFYLHGPGDQLERCCQSIPESQKTGRVARLCHRAKDRGKKEFYDQVAVLGADLLPPTKAELAQPFDPRRCLFHFRGWGTLEGCSPHQFAVPLTSFFFSLKERLGRSLTTEFVQLLREGGTQAMVYECRYSSGAPSTPMHGPAPVVEGPTADLALRSLAPVFDQLRAGLTPTEKIAFDAAWKEHRFDLLVEFDRLLAQEIRSLGFHALAARHPREAGTRGCSSLYTFKPGNCELSCLRR